MKEFYGSVSLAAQIDFSIKAKSKDEAIEKIFNACCVDIKLTDENNKEIENFNIEQIDWNLIHKASKGNVMQSYIDDFEIQED